MLLQSALITSHRLASARTGVTLQPCKRVRHLSGSGYYHPAGLAWKTRASHQFHCTACPLRYCPASYNILLWFRLCCNCTPFPDCFYGRRCEVRPPDHLVNTALSAPSLLHSRFVTTRLLLGGCALSVLFLYQHRICTLHPLHHRMTRFPDWFCTTSASTGSPVLHRAPPTTHCFHTASAESLH